MPKKIIFTWLAGALLVLILMPTGLLFNLRKQPVNAPACVSGYDRNDSPILGCPHDNVGKFYLTGWPKKMYCYDNAKMYCSSNPTFYKETDDNNGSEMWKGNITHIVTLSISAGLLFIALVLSQFLWVGKNHAHTRH